MGANLTVEQWYYGLLEQVGRHLRLEDELEDYWHAHRSYGPLRRWMAAIHDLVLSRTAASITIFVDEIDIVRSLPFSTDEFFAAIRECYNRRAQEPDFERLTFCLLGVAAPGDLIRDTRLTPFNIGRRITLNDFTSQEASPLSVGINLADRDGYTLLERVLYWTGGHPYLSQLLCASIVANDAILREQDVDALCSNLFLAHRARETDDNLQFVRNRLLKSEVDLFALLQLYSDVLAGKRVSDHETNPLVGLLKLSGIVRVENGLLKVRNRIYERVFDREWVLANMPDGELRRQRAAYRVGVIRTLALSGAVLLMVSGLAVFGFVQAHRAQELAHKAQELGDKYERSAYISSMNLIQHDFEENNFQHSAELLDEAKSSKYRGFEWNYWYHKHHQELLSLNGHTDFVHSVAISSDGKRIVTGSWDHTACVWDANTGQTILTLKGHTHHVNAVAISPDGKRIVTGSYDHTARVWDASTGQSLLTLKGHTGGIESVAISSDGKRIVTGSEDGSARVWDIATGRSLVTLQTDAEGISSVAISSDGKRIVTGSWDHTARVWDASTGQTLLILKGHTGAISAVAISSDGRRIVTVSADKTGRVWDASTGQSLLTLKGHTDFVEAVAISSDGKRIVTGSRDKTARVWDASTGQTVLTLKGHTEGITSVAISSDGKRIVTGGLDNTARVWE